MNLTLYIGSVTGSFVLLSINKGKKERPEKQGSPVLLSIVSKLTTTKRVGLSFCPLSSNLKPKKGFLLVEYSVLAKPRCPGTGYFKSLSMHLTRILLNIVLSGRNLAQSI